MLQLNVTALFYLENSRKIHPPQRLKKKRVGERTGAWERERETPGPLAPLFICFFSPPGPALCKLG